VTALLALFGVVIAGAVLAALAWWLERTMQRPGVGSLIAAVAELGVSAFTLAEGQRLVPLLCLMLACFFIYSSVLKARAGARAA